MTGFLIAFLGAFCWAGLDVSRKFLVRGVDAVAAAAWVALLQAPVFLAWSLLAAGPSPSVGYWLPGGIGLLLQVAANVLFFRALAISPLSLTIPFLSLTPVFTSLIGLVLLGERPTAIEWLGILLVVLGALGLHGGGTSLIAALRRERGSLFMMGVALLWSVTSNLSKLALDHASVPWHATIQASGVGLAILAFLLVRKDLRVLRVPAASRRWLVASLLFSLVALTCQLTAIQLILVGLVETVKRGVGMISSVVLGRALFHESMTAAKVVAVLLMALGCSLLLL